MANVDAPRLPDGHGIVRKNWTDLRNSSAVRNDPSFKPWLIGEKSADIAPNSERHLDDLFKSKEQCERAIGMYRRIVDINHAEEAEIKVNYFC